MPQPHGGALLPGAGGGNNGGGRPSDELRAKLRELGLKGAVPVLKGVLDGKLTVPLVGKCGKCGNEKELDGDEVEHIADQLRKMTDQQLKASDLALKHGLTMKELTITSQDAAAFFDCVHTACVELVGDAAAERIKQRAIELAEQRK